MSDEKYSHWIEWKLKTGQYDRDRITTKEDLKAMLVTKYYGQDSIPTKDEAMRYLLKECRYWVNPALATEVTNEWWDSKYGKE